MICDRTLTVMALRHSTCAKFTLPQAPKKAGILHPVHASQHPPLALIAIYTLGDMSEVVRMLCAL